MHLQNGATSDETMFGYPKRIRASRKSMRQGETARYSASFNSRWQAAIISFSGKVISESSRFRSKANRSNNSSRSSKKDAMRRAYDLTGRRVWPKEGESARLSSFSYMGWAIGCN